MRTIKNIRDELERAVERRAELSRQIDELWAEARALRAHDRFGPSDAIRARARAEERLERDSRRLKAA
jgi:hypothetical protein